MTTSIETDIAALKETHPAWEQEQIRAVLEFVDRGHRWEISRNGDGNKPADRVHRQEMREVQGRFTQLGISDTLVSVRWDENKGELYLHLDDQLTFTPEELALITTHVAERKAEKLAKFEALSAHEKLARAVSNYIQLSVAAPGASAYVPAMANGQGEDALDFLTEKGNETRHQSWLRNNLGQFFASGETPSMSFKGSATESRLMDGEELIRINTKGLADADLDMPRVMELLQSTPDKPAWGELMQEHHARRRHVGGKEAVYRNMEVQPANIVSQLHHALNCEVEGLDVRTAPTTPSLMDIGGKQYLVFRSEEPNAQSHRDVIGNKVLPRFFKDGAMPALEILGSDKTSKFQQGEVGIGFDVGALKEEDLKMTWIETYAKQQTGRKSWRDLQDAHQERLVGAARG